MFIESDAQSLGAAAQRNEIPAKLRLAAIDLDGTLLGPEATIGAENLAAVERLASEGFEIVLASGRHHRSMGKFAGQLPMVRWLVSSQGGEVADVPRAQVLTRSYLRQDQVTTIMGLQAEYGVGAVYYLTDDVYIASDNDSDQTYYFSGSGRKPCMATMAELARMPVYKILWLAEPPRVAALNGEARLKSLGLQTVQTHERIFEFMPTTTTKAAGLAVLTRHLGLAPENVVSFGDADNDIPMFKWSGFSYAMPHGWPNARASASRVAPAGPEESAFARGVAELLAK